MAKTKSKKISIVDALLPVEEQPYEVPENWCWTRVSNVAQVIMGQSPAGESTTEEDSYMPLIGGASDMGKLYPTVNRYTKEPTKITNEGDLILCIRATLGRPIYADGQYCLGRGVAGIRSKYISKEFLRYLYLSNEQYLYDNATGTTFAQVTSKVIESMPIPFPPIAEQHRIVEQIESLFSKLDEARDKIQEALEGFDLRQASVLYDAFNGRLTAKWREEKNIALNTWKNNPLEEVFRLRSGSTIDATEEQEKGSIPYVKVADMNMEENQIQIVTSSRFVDSCAESHEIPYGSTIFPKRGGAILTNKKRYVAVEKIIADLNIMAVIPVDKKIDGWYGYYWMQSIDLKELNNGSNVPQINNKDMIRLTVPTPSMEEQKEIVRILDIFSEHEREAYKNAESTIEAIDLLKKSILAKAFRGELGTTNLSDESAEELLKRIITEASVEEKKKSTTRKTKVNVDMNKDMKAAVKEARTITPEKLKEETGLGIDEFYEELKRLTESRQIVEKREGKEIYLEDTDANR